MWRKALLGLVILAAMGLGAVLALSRFLDPEELAGWLEPRLETALSRDVGVSQVKVGLFPLGVRLLDLTLSDPTGLAPLLAQVQVVELRVRILPLLRREIQLDRLTLTELQADLRVDNQGRSNFGDLSTRPATGAIPEESSGTQESFVFDFRRLVMVGGQIRYSNEKDSVQVELAELEAQASARREVGEGWQIAGSSQGEITLQMGEDPGVNDPAHVEVDFDLAADDGFESVSILDGKVRSGGISLSLAGEIRQLQDPVRSLSLVLGSEELSLSEFLAVLPDSLQERFPFQAEGMVAVDLKVEGELGPGHQPSLTGSVGLSQGRVTMRGESLAQDLEAQLELEPDWVVKSQTHGSVLAGPFSLEGTTTLGRLPSLDMLLEASPDLGTLGSFVQLPEGVTSKGILPSSIRISGPTGNLRELRFRGKIQAMGVEAVHPKLGVPLEIPEGEVLVDGKQALLVDFPLILGEDEVKISGTLDDLTALFFPEEIPHFEGVLRASRLNLQALSPRPQPDPDLTYGKVAFAKVGDRPLGGRGFQAVAEELGFSRPESFPMAGSLGIRMDTVIDHRGHMETVQAQVDFGPAFLQVSNATFRRYGGEIQTSVDLSLSPDEAAPFSFSLSVSGLDAGEFLAATTPLGTFVQGTISMDLDLVGTVDGFLLPDRPALVGSGRFSLKNGGLASSPLTRDIATFLGFEALQEPAVEDWEGSFLLENGNVLLAEGTLRGAPGTPAVGGSVGLNGELSLRSAFQLPIDRLNTSALDRLGIAGEIAGNVIQRPEVVQAILRIGGSVFDPAVDMDPMAAAQTLGDAVEEEVRTEVSARIEAEKAEAERILEEQRAEAQRKIEEQKEELRGRATGFLRGLMNSRDTAQALPPDTTGGSPPPDSIRPDTTPPDTLVPDTLLPDTLLPDTVVPDTVVPDTVVADTIRQDTLSGLRATASLLETSRFQEYHIQPVETPQRNPR